MVVAQHRAGQFCRRLPIRYNALMHLARPQFRLSTLLWLTLAVACFFGGIRFERWSAERNAQEGVTRGRIEDTYDKFDAPMLHKRPFLDR
jgi:hypothetical protein